MFYEKSLSKHPKISKRGEMENFVISAQIWELNQLFIKSLKFFPHKIFGVANDSKNKIILHSNHPRLLRKLQKY